MSLGVVIKGPEGVVLAADSRVTLTAERKGSPPLPINFDNATKLLSFSKPHNYVAIVTYGAAVIGLRTAHSYIPEFEVELPKKNRLKALDYAERFSKFFLRQWKANMPDDYPGPSMMFVVGGYDPEAAYGRIYLLDIPRNPEPIEQNPGDTNFGMTWGGQLQIASRMIHGYDPILPTILKRELEIDDDSLKSLLSTLKENIEFSIPYQVLPLQDCVDLATLMVRTTIKSQNLSIGLRGVGGPIDVATITRTNGLRYIQRKSITIDEEES
ncbi:MAG TPA: hypothetical protein G4O11_09805 [Anaerolineae bacterium]|nr:hypothetical protein [Anaerolineae bacterium]